MVVTSCTAAQRCADLTNKNTYNKRTNRVPDEDFNSLFTDSSVVTTSSIHCLTLCTTNQTNTRAAEDDVAAKTGVPCTAQCLLARIMWRSTTSQVRH